MNTPNKAVERREYAATIPDSNRGAYVKAMKGSSLRAAINAKCHNCMGYESVVDRIRNCTSWKSCPLWEVRPYQLGAEETEELD